MTQILFPKSPNAQGYAFEDLIHRILPDYGYHILLPSGWYHYEGWYQLDGVIESNQERWLLEIKFTQTPLTPKTVNLKRRIEAMQASNCTGILYVSLVSVSKDLENEHKNLQVPFHNIVWEELQPLIPRSQTNLITSILDEIEYNFNENYFEGAGYKLVTPQLQLQNHPLLQEFYIVPDHIEIWIKRIPLLSQYEQSIAPSIYKITESGIEPYYNQYLSIDEAWKIQDALSGYSSRVLTAIEQTLIALAKIRQGTVKEIQVALPEGVTTGVSGVRSSLSNLVLWALTTRYLVNRNTIYEITPLGYAVIARGSLDYSLFGKILEEWTPYKYFLKFLNLKYYSLNPIEIIDFFRGQYQPFSPYAKSLFNPNKVDGLIHIYSQLSGNNRG